MRSCTARHPISTRVPAKNALVFDAFYANVGFTANAPRGPSAVRLSLHDVAGVHPGVPHSPGRPWPRCLPPGTAARSSPKIGFLDYVNQGRFLKGRGYEQLVAGHGRGRAPQLLGRPRGPRPPTGPSPGSTPRQAQPSSSSEPAEPSSVPSCRTSRWWTSSRRSRVLQQRLRPWPYQHRGQRGSRDRPLAGLRERGLDQNTIVVVTGDHGEAFGDPHPTWGPRLQALRGSGPRAPLMIWSPSLFPADGGSNTVGGQVTRTPPLAHLVGGPPGRARAFSRATPRAQSRGERQSLAEQLQVRLQRYPREGRALRPRGRSRRQRTQRRREAPRPAAACSANAGRLEAPCRPASRRRAR